MPRGHDDSGRLRLSVRQVLQETRNRECFFYVGGAGLPRIQEHFVQNLARVNKIKAYEARRMQYIFYSSGPELFSQVI